MTCQRCGEHEATKTWAAGLFEFAHGLSQQWCTRCVLTAQLAHARESAAQVPALELALKAEQEKTT